MEEFYIKFGDGLRGFPTRNGGGRKLWGEFFQKFGEGLRGLPKCNIGGRSYGVILQRIWRVSAWIFKNAILAGGDFGRIY